jgi:iron complex outermembrane recepter protein
MRAPAKVREGGSRRGASPAGRPGRRSKIAVAVAAALAGVALRHAAAVALDAAAGADAAPNAAAATVPAVTAAGPPAPSGGGGVAEVIVSARKVEENLQDVPISVSVFTEKDMQNLGITSFDDWATRDPSVSFISTGPGTQTLIIRGVSDGSNPNESNTSLTGFFLDDMSLSYYSVQPDLHLYDVERVEILKGPQGTTFGAGSMSGAVRYITNKPDVNNFSAGVDGEFGSIEHAGNNYTYEGFMNLPLVQGSLGLRLSVYEDVHGGFVDNKLVTRDWVNGVVSNNSLWAGNDYNTNHTEGARVALKEVFNDKWSAWADYMYQQQNLRGAWDQLPALYGDDAVARFGPEMHKNDAAMAEGHVDGDVGIGDLVFATTYWNLSERQLNEYSEYMQYAQTSTITPAYLQGFVCKTDPVSTPGDAFTGCNVPILYYKYDDYTRRWSDELRLSSKPGGRFHWLGGLYWEHTEDQSSNVYTMPGIQYGGQAWKTAAYGYYATLPTPPPQLWYAYLTYSDYVQSTEFVNINYDLTDRLNVEAGTVHFHYNFSSHSPYTGYSYYWETGPGQLAGPTSSSASSHKWDSRFGLNYKLLDNVLVYADFAQGFRPGGANSGFTPACYKAGVPQVYEPDTLDNYELGLKTTLFDRHLVWNSAIYYMPWKSFQTGIYDPDICLVGTYYANLGNARVYGGESNVDWKFNDHWSLQGAVNYTDAELTSNVYNNEFFYVPPGTRLPYSPYFDWSGNVRYETHLSGELLGYAQYDIAYKGDMYNNLEGTTTKGFPRILQPPYDIMNLRFGVNPESEGWMAELYIENLANKNAVIYTNTGNYDLRETTNQPRTFGIRMNYRWGKK